MSTHLEKVFPAHAAMVATTYGQLRTPALAAAAKDIGEARSDERRKVLEEVRDFADGRHGSWRWAEEPSMVLDAFKEWAEKRLAELPTAGKAAG